MIRGLCAFKLVIFFFSNKGRQYYVCDLCRSAKNITAPPTVCIKCAPAMKTVSNVLQKKDTAITDYTKKLIQLEAEIR